MVAKDVLDPSAEVPTNKMIAHDIVRQFRQRRKQILDGSSTSPRRAVRTREDERLLMTYRNLGVLLTMTNMGCQTRTDTESRRRIAGLQTTRQKDRLVDRESAEERQPFLRSLHAGRQRPERQGLPPIVDAGDNCCLARVQDIRRKIGDSIGD